MPDQEPTDRSLDPGPESDLPPWLRSDQIKGSAARPPSIPTVTPMVPKSVAVEAALPPWVDPPAGPRPGPASPGPRLAEPVRSIGQMPRRRLVVVAAGIVALGLVGSIVGWQLTRDPQTTTVQPPGRSAIAPTSAQSSVPVVVPSSESAAPTLSPTAATPSTPSDPESVAKQQLAALARQGLAAHSLDSRWVAQLASKSVGITDPLQVTESGSHKFNASDILAEHRRLDLETTDGSDVFMLRSTDYGKGQRYKGKILWVTFADGGFTDRSEVVQWCRSRFPGLSGDKLANQCFPNRLRPLSN